MGLVAVPRAFVMTCGVVGVSISAEAGSIIVPDDLKPGQSFQLAFVTSGAISALSSDIDVYNGFVTDAAAAAGLDVVNGQAVKWTAIASTASVNASDNAPQTAPVYDVQARLIAAPGTFWDNIPVFLEKPIDTTEFGVQLESGYVWTGSDDRGQGTRGVSLGIFFASYGNLASPFSSWISSGIYLASAQLPVYALSSPILVPVAEGGTGGPGGGTGDPGGGTGDPGGGTGGPGGPHAVPEASSLRLGALSLLTMFIGWLRERGKTVRGERYTKRDVEVL